MIKTLILYTIIMQLSLETSWLPFGFPASGNLKIPKAAGEA